MPIFQTVIQGGGTTPTGTKPITANGVYDVTDFANADVQVPTTAPDCYVEFQKTSNMVSKGNTVLDFSTGQRSLNYSVFYYLWSAVSFYGSVSINWAGITRMYNYACYYSYANTQGITSFDLSGLTQIDDFACAHMFDSSSVGSVNLSSLTTIGQSGCDNMFFKSKLTSFDLSSLTTVSNASACQYMFASCYYLTTASLPSLQTISGNSGCAYMFNNDSVLTTASLPSLQTISGTYACSLMFAECSALTSVDLSSLKSVNSQLSCQQMFINCSSLPTIDLSSLETVAGNKSLQYTFRGCTSLTSANLSGLKTITAGTYNQEPFSSTFYGCSNLTTVDISGLTTVGQYAFNQPFYNCPLSNVTLPATPTAYMFRKLFAYSGISSLSGIVNFPSVIDKAYMCNEMFSNCTSLTGTVDLSAVKSINDPDYFTVRDMFSGCSGITGVDLSNLEHCTRANMMFDGNTGLAGASINFLSLHDLGINGLKNMFYSVRLGSISLPAIYEDSFDSGSTNQLYPIMANASVTGFTMHFPKNFDTQNNQFLTTLAGYPNFGGPNAPTTLVFDLPSTLTLTGADTKTYRRNPKYDTATALGWYDTSATMATPYYTSTTNDPAVGDTIYSDAACTTAVTTISSIA